MSKGTPYEIQRKGMAVLIRELGYADAVRFMLQFRSGHGDYARDRDQLIGGATLDELLTEGRRRMTEGRARTRRRRRSA